MQTDLGALICGLRAAGCGAAHGKQRVHIILDAAGVLRLGALLRGAAGAARDKCQAPCSRLQMEYEVTRALIQQGVQGPEGPEGHQVSATHLCPRAIAALALVSRQCHEWLAPHLSYPMRAVHGAESLPHILQLRAELDSMAEQLQRLGIVQEEAEPERAADRERLAEVERALAADRERLAEVERALAADRERLAEAERALAADRERMAQLAIELAGLQAAAASSNADVFYCDNKHGVCYVVCNIAGGRDDPGRTIV